MIFLDANFIINFYVKNYKYHERAKKLMKSFKNDCLVVSKLVIVETITVMAIKLKQNPELISKVYKELNEYYNVLIDNNHYDKGFEIFQREFKNKKQRLPLFDCVYMALMKDLGIKQIASFDKHFDNKEGIERVY